MLTATELEPRKEDIKSMKIDTTKFVKEEGTDNPILRAIGNISGKISYSLMKYHMRWGTWWVRAEEVAPVKKAAKKTVKKVAKKAPAKKAVKKTAKKAVTKKK